MAVGLSFRSIMTLSKDSLISRARSAQKRRRCPQELVTCPEGLVINWTECLCNGPRKKDPTFLDPPWQKTATTDFSTDCETDVDQQCVHDEETDMVPETMYHHPTVTIFNVTRFQPNVFILTETNPATLFDMEFNPVVFFKRVFHQTRLNATLVDLSTFHTTRLYHAVFDPTIASVTMFDPTVTSVSVFVQTLLDQKVLYRSTSNCSTSEIQERFFSAFPWIQGDSSAVLPWDPAYLVILEHALWTAGLGVALFRLAAAKRELARVHAEAGERRSHQEAVHACWRSLEKENGALRKQRRFLRNAAKLLKGKHLRLCQQAKEYRKTLSDTKEAVAARDDEIEILSGLSVYLEKIYKLQGHDSTAVSRDRAAAVVNQATSIKNKIELLLTDISQVQTHLCLSKQQLDHYRVGMDKELLFSRPWRGNVSVCDAKWRR